MKRVLLLIAGLLTLAWLPTTRAADVLQRISWAELEEAGTPLAGEVLPAELPEQGKVLKIENPEDQPKQVTLLELKDPGITGPAYAIRGQIRYESVAGKSFLEMWSYFPDGGSYFSRTLSEIGPMGHLHGTSDWRDFTLPFFINREEMGRPQRLVVNLVLQGKGTVYVGPVELEQYETLPAAFQIHRGWWGARAGVCIGVLLGLLLGLAGTLLGVLAGRSRAREFVMALTAATVLFGVALVGAGATALLVGQPYEVWFPLLLCGAISAGVFGALRRPIRRRYDQRELEQISAVDLGAASG